MISLLGETRGLGLEFGAPFHFGLSEPIESGWAQLEAIIRRHLIISRVNIKY